MNTALTTNGITHDVLDIEHGSVTTYRLSNGGSVVIWRTGNWALYNERHAMLADGIAWQRLGFTHMQQQS